MKLKQNFLQLFLGVLALTGSMVHASPVEEILMKVLDSYEFYANDFSTIWVKDSKIGLPGGFEKAAGEFWAVQVNDVVADISEKYPKVSINWGERNIQARLGFTSKGGVVRFYDQAGKNVPLTIAFDGDISGATYAIDSLVITVRQDDAQTAILYDIDVDILKNGKDKVPMRIVRSLGAIKEETWHVAMGLSQVQELDRRIPREKPPEQKLPPKEVKPSVKKKITFDMVVSTVQSLRTDLPGYPLFVEKVIDFDDLLSDIEMDAKFCRYEPFMGEAKDTYGGIGPCAYQALLAHIKKNEFQGRIKAGIQFAGSPQDVVRPVNLKVRPVDLSEFKNHWWDYLWAGGWAMNVIPNTYGAVKTAIRGKMDVDLEVEFPRPITFQELTNAPEIVTPLLFHKRELFIQKAVIRIRTANNGDRDIRDVNDPLAQPYDLYGTADIFEPGSAVPVRTTSFHFWIGKNPKIRILRSRLRDDLRAFRKGG